MTDVPQKPAPPGRSASIEPLKKSGFAVLMKHPGLAAISLYMMLLAGLNVVSVINQHADPLLLILSPLFIAGALGLLLLLRWAWALTIAGLLLMTGRFTWAFASQHDLYLLVEALLNLVFFFYLVRTEVREKLK